MIDTASNTVIATVGVGLLPQGVSITSGVGPPNIKESVQDGRLENLHNPAEIQEPR